MKTIKDLKIGDICYKLDNNNVTDVKVVNISKSMQTGRYCVTFMCVETDCEPVKYIGHPEESVFYTVNEDIYLELHPIILILKHLISCLEKETRRLMLKELTMHLHTNNKEE